MKHILGVTFCDRVELEGFATDLVQAMTNDSEKTAKLMGGWLRKVGLPCVMLTFGLFGVVMKICSELVKAPIRIFLVAVKELGEIVMISTNPFVLCKNEEKEASE